MLLRIVIAALLVSCGGKKQSDSAPPGSAAPAAPMTPEECTKQGGQVRGDIGDGQIKCADGERDLGRVTVGIEGGVCCAKS